MPREIIVPGAGLVSAGRALEDPKRLAGAWPYQWLFPGPNSRHVLAQKSVAMPTPGNSLEIFRYEVPTGMRFSLRGVVCAVIAAGWDEGSTPGLQFDLTVVGTGSRNVDFLSGIRTHLGSLDSPYPILGRLEFQPLDVLIWTITNEIGSGVAGAFPDAAVAHLVGHTYPNSEAA